MRLLPLLFLLFGVAYGESNWNPYQPLQPGGSSALAGRLGNSYPVPTFSVDFSDGNTQAEIGASTTATFSRASSRYAPTTPTLLSEFTTGNAALEAFGFNSNTLEGGIYVGKPHQNDALRSEEFDNAVWNTIGSPTTTANFAVAPDGATTAEKIVCAANGDGKLQTTSASRQSRPMVWSMWVKAATTDVDLTLTLNGTLGDAETTTQSFTAISSRWTRAWVYKSFSSAATGTAVIYFDCDEAGTIYVWGGQLEDTTKTNYRTFVNFPSSYNKTVAAATVSEVDNIQWAGSNITDVNVYSTCIWAHNEWPTDAVNGASSMALWGIRDDTSVEYCGTLEFTTVPSTSLQMRLNGSNVNWNNDGADNAGGEWHHYCTSLNFTTDTYKIYRDGVLRYTDTTARTPCTTGPTRIEVGGIGRGTALADRAWEGVLSRFKYWAGVELGDEFVTVYNSERAKFGR